MDVLKAELANKRKALTTDATRPAKYMRRGDIEKLEQEKREQEEREKQWLKEENAKSKSTTPAASIPPSRSQSKEASMPPDVATPPPSNPTEDDAATAAGSSVFNISNEEAIRRLRAKGQPIRLFGESDKDRRLRLRALELIEERGHERNSGQNDFRKALEDVESVEREMKNRNAKGKKKEETETAATILDLGLVKSDPDRLYPLIYHALKRTLKEWEEAMDERPESVKRTTQGKLAAATQVQSAQYLKPLFKQLRSRSLPLDMLSRMAEIVHYMQKREYQKANDAYLRLSIGNAPWPIGVTMVGIHERSAREKISADQVAHVLNDEVSRKYIQSLKRLLTFAQTKYPPDDISQLMG